MLPPTYVIDSIRGLEGKARVTFPGAKADVFKVERIVKEQKQIDWLAKYPYYIADVEFPTAELIDHQVLKEDHQYREIYLAYHVLPGVLLSGIETHPETNKQVSVTRQIVKNTAELPENGNGIVWEKQPIDDAIAIHISRNVTSILGYIIQDRPEVSYTFPGILKTKGRVLNERTQPAGYTSARSEMVKARREIYFTTEEENEPTFKWKGVNVRTANGTYADVLHNLRAVIIDGRSIKIEASEPRATEYRVGDEVLISAPSEISDWGLYRNERIWIPLQ